MSRPLESYALIGDTHSAALVSDRGSIDWLCLPRFDSPSCFGALLDEDVGGNWSIAPAEDIVDVRRCYRDRTLILETEFESRSGTVQVVDCMSLAHESASRVPRDARPDEVVVRIVKGLEGTVPMRCEFRPRFGYGDVVPWFRVRHGDVIEAVGGPDALDLVADVPLTIRKGSASASFDVEAGHSVSFLCSYHAAHLTAAPHASAEAAVLVEATQGFWRDWTDRYDHHGLWGEEVLRSMLTLKALVYSPTGGAVAAPTTSLPEQIGGTRNWDYRYCWLRDATFTLQVFLEHGYVEEAEEWRDWLLRAVAGDPEDIQIMYGLQGERRLYEHELPWLKGYEESAPVRIGNAAHAQFQLDVYGEVMDSFHLARRAGVDAPPEAWELQRDIVEFVSQRWREPDEGIWEVRSGRRHFVHSKVMAWVALDRAIKAVEDFDKQGPVDRWRSVRESIRDEVMALGVDARHRRFRRAYDDDALDASLLMLPLVGFIDATHPLMQHTIDGIQKDLVEGGLVLRYRTDEVDDGLPAGEGTFLLCTFWLVDCLVLSGRREEAEDLYHRLLGLRNDVGLLSEQYDAVLKRQVGNFPQAFSHVALAMSAMFLDEELGAALRR